MQSEQPPLPPAIAHITYPVRKSSRLFHYMYMSLSNILWGAYLVTYITLYPTVEWFYVISSQLCIYYSISITVVIPLIATQELLQNKHYFKHATIDLSFMIIYVWEYTMAWNSRAYRVHNSYK